MRTMFIHEKIPGTVVLKTLEIQALWWPKDPRFPGGVGVVFQLPSMGGSPDFYWNSL